MNSPRASKAMSRWCAAVILCVAARGVQAQDSKDPKAPPPDGERSLDELLGIGDGDGAKSAQESARDRSSNLKRVLTEQEAKNTLEAAVEGMRRSGALLSQRDLGTAVQRVQEDVLARLDALINTAEQQQQQQQQQQSSSSSSPSEQQQQQQPQQPARGGPQRQQRAPCC